MGSDSPEVTVAERGVALRIHSRKCSQAEPLYNGIIIPLATFDREGEVYMIRKLGRRIFWPR